MTMVIEIPNSLEIPLCALLRGFAHFLRRFAYFLRVFAYGFFFGVFVRKSSIIMESTPKHTEWDFIQQFIDRPWMDLIKVAKKHQVGCQNL